MVEPLKDLSRLCIHTITTKPWNLVECLSSFRNAGVGHVTVWRQNLEPLGLAKSAKLIRDSGLKVAGLCRGGYFPGHTEADRAKALDENRRAIEEAHAIGAPVIVLVCGGVPGIELAEQRKMIRAGIEGVVADAKAANVTLAIEPLHPMYADTRSAISTMTQAREIAEAIDSPHVGIAVDVYHTWWDDRLEDEIRRAGKKIVSFHVCDWRTPTEDVVNDRGLMGDGCIPIRKIRGWVEKTGFAGPIEVEIFSNRLWAENQAAFVERIKRAYLEHV